MRYIGSKTNLLDELNLVVKPYAKMNKFCDIFAGTGSVGRFFKPQFEITSNDALFFSYALQKACIELDETPKFSKLVSKIQCDPITFLSNLDESTYKFKKNKFIYENYSPTNVNERMYLSNSNALRVDAFRQLIDEWRESNLINELEYFYLIASVVEAVPFVSNIAGTYGAYLKTWDKRTQKRINPIPLPIITNNKNNKSYNEDVNDLIKKISGDILYIDPPYNGRQYLTNYHLLETIARYDNPEIKGVTGIRNDRSALSDYCRSTKVSQAFNQLIEDANFKVIFVSYSNEGFMSSDEIASILQSHGKKSTFKLKTIPYRRYKRTSTNEKNNLNEYIFKIEK